MDRRHFVFSTAAAALAACGPRIAFAQQRPLVYADMHSHIGILGGRADVREAMVANGMLVVARKIVADGPVIRRFPGKGIQQVREPAAGELAGRFDKAFERLKAEHRSQNRVEIVDVASLKRVLEGSEPGGPAHVGVGTDLFGLGGSTVIPGYEQFGRLEELMVRRGLKTEDVRNMLGGNYLRVLDQALTA